MTWAPELENRCARALETCPSDARALLLVPPFASLPSPSLGAHVLQACARQAGHQVGVLYASLLFATLSGEELYSALTPTDRAKLWGERLFAPAAFGQAPITPQEVTGEANTVLHGLPELQAKVTEFCSILATAVAARGFAVVGSSTNFEQTCASFALLAAVKRARPETLCILGGANCEGEMAEGMASLPGAVDTIFSGECESEFPKFLARVAEGHPNCERIIRGTPCENLDLLPDPDYGEYYAQLEITLGSERGESAWIPYETSRGCWYGEKHPCSFCGLNGKRLSFRHKSPDRTLAGLESVLRFSSQRRVIMTDCIMPHSYFRTFLPRLAAELPGAHIFYEVKANLTLEQVRLLMESGVEVVQPGIEALSGPLLQRMHKGVSARQNVALLRYSRSLGLALNWNLLTDIPGDDRAEYESTLEILPLLHHLEPPIGAVQLRIDRFSPYFDDPGRYGIADLKPVATYHRVFPESVDLQKLVYFFEGIYTSAVREDPELFCRLGRGVEEWRKKWDRKDSPEPALYIAQVSEEAYLLSDTRGLPGTDMFRFLSAEEAGAALAGGPIEKQHLHDWAVENKLAIELDGYSVPLAVSDYETMERFERENKASATFRS